LPSISENLATARETRSQCTTVRVVAKSALDALERLKKRMLTQRSEGQLPSPGVSTDFTFLEREFEDRRKHDIFKPKTRRRAVDEIVRADREKSTAQEKQE
jgi:hypothetical protein